MTGLPDGGYFLLNTPYACVGSGKTCDIRLNDTDILRLTAEIRADAGRFSIRTLAPRGSLFLDKKLSDGGPLINGTEIRIGLFYMKVELVPIRMDIELPDINVQRTVDPPLQKVTDEEQRLQDIGDSIYRNLGVNIKSIKLPSVNLKGGNGRLPLMVAILVLLGVLAIYINFQESGPDLQQWQKDHPELAEAMRKQREAAAERRAHSKRATPVETATPPPENPNP